MYAGSSRRHFIRTGGSFLLLLPFIQYCNSKSKNTKKETDKTTVNKAVTHVRKRKKQAIVASMVTNRGWYKNKKNSKIHYFDHRGFTPSLQYLKNQQEFTIFIQHLEPWDVKLLTLEIFEKNVSKKNKDWITENAALAFSTIGNYPAALAIIKKRIEKSPANVRMWDLMTMITLRSGEDQIKAIQQELITKYSSTKEPTLLARLAKYNNPEWQKKCTEKGLTWNNQKI